MAAFLSLSLFKEKCSCTRTRRLLQEAAVGESGKQAKKQERGKRPRLAWQIPNGPGDLRLYSGSPVAADHGDTTAESKTADKGGYCVFVSRSFFDS